MIEKAVSRNIGFTLRSSVSGQPDTTVNVGSVTCKISKDGGAFITTTNAPTTILEDDVKTGEFNLTLTSAEMNADSIIIKASATGCIEVRLKIATESNYTAERAVKLDNLETAIIAIQADLGDPSVDVTTIYDKIKALPVNPVNVMSATKGAIQVSYAKSAGTVEVVKGDTISVPYGPFSKDITGRRLYFAAKQLLSDATYKIAVKEVTAQVTNFTTFTGTIPLTSAELNLTAGDYYAEIESRASDGTSSPCTEVQFTLRVVDQVIG